MVSYYARENDIGEAIGEVCITLGELQRVDLVSLAKQEEIGVRVDLTSFLPARIKPVIHGKQAPCISMTIHKDSHGSLKMGDWKVRSIKSKITLKMEGQDATDSPRVKAGLTDVACKDIVNSSKTSFNAKSYQNAS